MARHAVPKPPRRGLLKAGLTVTAVGAALSAGAGAAQAAPSPLPVAGPLAGLDQALGESGPTPGRTLTGALQHAVSGGLGPAKSIQLDPLAGTAADPLNNTVGTQIADFRPISTGAATAPLAEGAALKDLPVVGAVARILPG